MREKITEIKIKNDLPRLKESSLIYKLKDNSDFSFGYILLLVSSSVVSTLGLLLGNTSIVIGGMIIAPLMWPLLKVSIGIAFENKNVLVQALKTLVLSVLIGFVSAYLIAVISPLKQLNAEILSRTVPTFLDLIIALFAGAVAAFAIMRPRISENLAGVAIAASLMPPLAASGIGLAFSNFHVFFDSLILFFVNVFAIVFISIFIFAFLVKRLHPEDILKRKGFIIVLATLIFTSVPLLFFLRSYSFEIAAYSKVEEVLSQGLSDISPSIYLSNLIVSIESSDDVGVTAEILVPEDLSLDFNQRQKLVALLRETLGREVDLSLKVQRHISVVTKERSEKDATRASIVSDFINLVEKNYPRMTVDFVQANENETDGESYWVITADLRSPPGISFSSEDLNLLNASISELIGQRTEIVIDLIPRAKISTMNTDSEYYDVVSTAQDYLYSTEGNFEVTSIFLDVEESTESETIYNFTLDLLTSGNTDVAAAFRELRQVLSEKFSGEFNFSLDIFSKQEATY